MRRLIPAQRGLTLIELAVGLAIAALLAVAAAPALSDYMTNSRLRESGNQLLAEALYAQSEAIKRNGVVRLTVDGNTLRVTDETEEGEGGVLRERPLPQGIGSLTRQRLDFGSQGQPAPFPTQFTVDLAKAGITCSADYRCPSLRVDAGGAIRLCGDKTNCN